MRASLVPGLTATERVVVDRGRTIDFLGQSLRVYSTPSMVNDIEFAALRLIAPHLGDGQSSVGVQVALEHLAATPLGEGVVISVRVVAVDGRRVTVEAGVRDALGEVGRGTHARHVIDVARHARRIGEQRARYPGAGGSA